VESDDNFGEGFFTADSPQKAKRCSPHKQAPLNIDIHGPSLGKKSIKKHAGSYEDGGSDMLGVINVVT
jgi:hypothetical protein